MDRGRNIGSRLAIACPCPGLSQPSEQDPVSSVCLSCHQDHREGVAPGPGCRVGLEGVRHIFMGSMAGPAMELQGWNSMLKFCLLCGQIESSSSLFQGLLASFSSQTAKQCCGVRTERFYLVVQIDFDRNSIICLFKICCLSTGEEVSFSLGY